MDHVAIMRKAWGLTEKILTGEKTIESRWYKSKYRPWNGIKINDNIYFKDAGKPISIKARVRRVLQFENLTSKKVREILNKYYKADGITKDKVKGYFELFKDKKYCLLIFLKNVAKVKPFNIDKSGFGAMVAWITVKNIKTIKKTLIFRVN